MLQNNKMENKRLKIKSILLATSIFIAAIATWIIFVVNPIGEEIITFDKNNDGKIDRWQYFRDGKLVKEIIDGNWNGRADGWVFWDKEGQVIKIKTLFEETGEKRTAYYKKGNFVIKNGQKMLKQELDTQKTPRNEHDYYKDGKIFTYTVNKKTIIERYLVDADSPKEVDCFEDDILIRSEIDCNNDGRADLIKYYEHSKLFWKEKDTNFDGKMDEVYKLNPETGELELQEGVVPTP